jgi:hypothetical protein
MGKHSYLSADGISRNPATGEALKDDGCPAYLFPTLLASGQRKIRPPKEKQRLQRWISHIESSLKLPNPTHDSMFHATRFARCVLLDDWASANEADLANECLRKYQPILDASLARITKKPTWKFHNQQLWSKS